MVTGIKIEKSVLTIEELSERWGVHKNTIRRRIQSGEIPTQIIGKGHKISIKWIELFENGEKTSKPPVERIKDDKVSKTRRLAEILESENRLDDARIKKAKNEKELAALEGLVVEARKVAALKQHLEKEDARLKALGANLDEKKRELEEREDTLDKDEEKCEADKEALKKREVEYEEHIKAEESRIAEHEASVVAHGAEVGKREQQVAEAESKIRSDRGKIARDRQKVNADIALIKEWHEAKGAQRKKHIFDKMLGY